MARKSESEMFKAAKLRSERTPQNLVIRNDYSRLSIKLALLLLLLLFQRTINDDDANKGKK
jgi:hypothetical protein